MKATIIRRTGAAILVLIWLALTAVSWLSKPGAISVSERRPLAQMPALNDQTLLSGTFMKEFDTYTLDQFPAREQFRKLKSLFHYYVLRQSDNNDIYIHNGYAAKLMYPLDEQAIEHAMGRLNHVYNTYLKDSGSQIYMAVIPDKSYYLASEGGYPALDYEKLFASVEASMPWAEHISLTDALTISDYYKTDIHWRQENLIPAAQKLAQAMDLVEPKAEDYREETLPKAFYGVYYGQAALPMDPEPMKLLTNDQIEGCTVYDHETGKTVPVYNLELLGSKDLYDVYLSGAKSLLTIENPNAQTDRELIVFRDSFASSMIPLLLQDYSKVTLVDTRYMSAEVLGNFLTFDGQDILFMYCTTVLNTKGVLR